MKHPALAVALWGVATLVLSSGIARAQSQILIDGDRVFPESLDAGSDGTLYIGSVGKGSVYKASPGETKATVWIDKAKGRFSAVTGVLADEADGKLWVCSTDLNRLGEPVSLKAFNIKNGDMLAEYAFPESKGLCNDIAIGKAGTAYVTDTRPGRIFWVKPNSKELEVWATDPRFEGVDGIAMGPGGSVYVNNVVTGLVFRVEVQGDGSAGAVTQITTSRPREGPDGMRPTRDGRFVFAENRGGRVSIGTFGGNELRIDTLKEGLENPAGVTVSGDTIWYTEMKSKYRNDPKFKDADPGAFAARAIPLPRVR